MSCLATLSRDDHFLVCWVRMRVLSGILKDWWSTGCRLDSVYWEGGQETETNVGDSGDVLSRGH